MHVCVCVWACMYAFEGANLGSNVHPGMLGLSPRVLNA